MLLYHVIQIIIILNYREYEMTVTMSTNKKRI